MRLKRSLNQLLLRKTDQEVYQWMHRIVVTDRKRKSDFLMYLSEARKRKLYAKRGYSCLLTWLIEDFKLSESTALKQMQVAALANRYRFLYRKITEGSYSLTALSRIAPYAKDALMPKIIRATEGKKVREVEAYLATQFPKEDVEDRLRKKITPLGENRHQVQFTADDAFVQDLEEAKALLSHKLPKGKLADVLGLALRTLLKDLKKPVRTKKEKNKSSEIPLAQEAQKATPATSKRRPFEESFESGSTRSRHIPRGMRQEVWERDQGKCQERRPDGSICGETHFLEFDHIQPFGLGGPHTKENLRLLCWAHNALQAETRFGKQAWLRQKQSKPERKPTSAPEKSG